MDDDEIINAKITSTHLGFEDHGMFSFMLSMQWDGTGQGFGGYRLDRYDHAQKCSVGTASGMDIIIGILNAVGVEKWEDLEGKYCRIKRAKGMIQAVGHITDGKWFDMREFAERIKSAASA